MTTPAPQHCPGCGELRGVTKAGRIVLHLGDQKKKTTGGRWLCSGFGAQVASKQNWEAPEMRGLDPMEAEAVQATYRASKAWRFIHQSDPPEEFERGLRALIASGSDTVTIVGAISIAAMKRGLPYEDQWRYACGVVRNELLRRVTS